MNGRPGKEGISQQQLLPRSGDRARGQRAQAGAGTESVVLQMKKAVSHG